MSSLRTVGEFRIPVCRLAPARLFEIALMCCGGTFESPLNGDIFETYIETTTLPKIRGVATGVRVYGEVRPSDLVSIRTWAVMNCDKFVQLHFTWTLIGSSIRMIYSNATGAQLRRHFHVAIDDAGRSAVDRATLLNGVAQRMHFPFQAEVANGIVVIREIQTEDLELTSTYPPKDPYSAQVGGFELMEDAFDRVIQSIPTSDVTGCVLLVEWNERTYDPCRLELSQLSRRWQVFAGSNSCDATKQIAVGDYSTLDPPFIFPLFQWYGTVQDDFCVIEGIFDVEVDGVASLRLCSTYLMEESLASWSKDLQSAIAEAAERP